MTLDKHEGVYKHLISTLTATKSIIIIKYNIQTHRRRWPKVCAKAILLDEIPDNGTLQCNNGIRNSMATENGVRNGGKETNYLLDSKRHSKKEEIRTE